MTALMELETPYDNIGYVCKEIWKKKTNKDKAPKSIVVKKNSFYDFEDFLDRYLNKHPDIEFRKYEKFDVVKYSFKTRKQRNIVLFSTCFRAKDYLKNKRKKYRKK